MITKELKVLNKLGFHARASAKLVQCANQFKSKLLIIKGQRQANAKSIMSLMMLSASCGSIISLVADGIDEIEAIASLTELINSKFNEEL